MKKLFVILLLLAIGVAPAMAQSMLKVSLSDRTPINVSLDGRYFNKTGQSVTVGDLPPGRHYLKIYETSEDRRGRAVQDVIYQGNVNTSYGAVTLFVLDANSGQTDIQHQDMSTYSANTQPMNSQGNGGAADNNGGNYNNNGNNNSNNGNYNNQQQNNNYDQNNNNGNNNNNNAPVASPISADEIATLTDSKIAKLKTKVAGKAADTQKLIVLKDALGSEKFTTDQLTDMMSWLIFDSSKVEFAEWAYPNTTDKENFSNLDSKFSYKTSQDDLDKFLQGK